MVEIQLNPTGSGSKLPDTLLILFAVCTTLLVAVHMLALLISTCILPNMEAISNLGSLRLPSFIIAFSFHLLKKYLCILNSV